jgi:hypothetical protein
MSLPQDVHAEDHQVLKEAEEVEEAAEEEVHLHHLAVLHLVIVAVQVVHLVVLEPQVVPEAEAEAEKELEHCI